MNFFALSPWAESRRSPRLQVSNCGAGGSAQDPGKCASFFRFCLLAAVLSVIMTVESQAVKVPVYEFNPKVEKAKLDDFFTKTLKPYVKKTGTIKYGSIIMLQHPDFSDVLCSALGSPRYAYEGAYDKGQEQDAVFMCTESTEGEAVGESSWAMLGSQRTVQKGRALQLC